MKNSSQCPASTFQDAIRGFFLYFLKAGSPQLKATHGMTLIETMVAIVILTVAIVAPMSLTMQSLSASYYARDQVIAFNLAQEAIETVRAIRDGNVLRISLSSPDASCSPVTLLCGIPIGTPFVIDTRNNVITTCSGQCPLLQTNGELYGYEAGWDDSPYRRTVNVAYVPGTQDEIRIEVTISWDAGTSQPRTITIYENLYRWVDDNV